MKREFLKELGIEQENIEKILAEHGKTVQGLQKESETTKVKIENLEKEIETRDKQLKSLKDVDVDELQGKIKKLQDDNTAQKIKYEQEIITKERSYAINEVLANAKVKNSKAVMGLLDDSKIAYADGQIVGLNEQLEGLKESDSYLFEATPTPTTNPASNSAGASLNETMNSLIRGTM